MSARVLGVTGCVGAGKSTVCRGLAALGFAVLDVDDVAASNLARAAVAIGREAPAVLGVDGRVRTRALFAALLGDDGLRGRVTAILRPYVVESIDAWRAALTGFGALDAALLFEQELDAFCDATLCVTCPRDERRRRVAMRTTASATAFDAIERAQLTEEEKAARADAVIASSEGPTALGDAVRALGFRSEELPR